MCGQSGNAEAAREGTACEADVPIAAAEAGDATCDAAAHAEEAGAAEAGDEAAREGYDWLDDPFDEQKAAEERAHAGMSGRAKLFVGCGCVLVAAALAVVLGLAAIVLAAA